MCFRPSRGRAAARTSGSGRYPWDGQCCNRTGTPSEVNTTRSNKRVRRRTAVYPAETGPKAGRSITGKHALSVKAWPRGTPITSRSGVVRAPRKTTDVVLPQTTGRNPSPVRPARDTWDAGKTARQLGARFARPADSGAPAWAWPERPGSLGPIRISHTSVGGWDRAKFQLRPCSFLGNRVTTGPRRKGQNPPLGITARPLDGATYLRARQSGQGR